MIHLEARRRHSGGLSFAVIPLAPGRSTSSSSRFSLGKKAFVPELRRGLDMCKALRLYSSLGGQQLTYRAKINTILLSNNTNTTQSLQTKKYH